MAKEQEILSDIDALRERLAQMDQQDSAKDIVKVLNVIYAKYDELMQLSHWRQHESD